MAQSYNVRYAMVKHQQANTDTLAKLHSRLADNQARKRARAEFPLPTPEEIQTLISENKASEILAYTDRLESLRAEYYPTFFNLGLEELMRLEGISSKSIRHLR